MGNYGLESLNKPTFYFIGVTTGKSSIMRVFPLWVEELGLPETVIRGFDIEVNGPPEKYRAIVKHIKEDKNAMGALVTTHKINIVKYAGDLFDYFDRYARIFGEVSSISKRDGKLRGHAKDPISSGLALEHFLPRVHWVDHPEAQAFIIGAGGSGIALSAYLMNKEHGDNIPSKIIISNRRMSRLDHCKKVHQAIGYTTEVEYVQVTSPEVNDRVISELSPYSLVVNATGMGKDLPGSPISDDTLFPENGYVWEFNYRGTLEFYHQAMKQKKERNLHVEDGWVYFLYGWTQVIGEVFDIEIKKEDVDRLGEVAKKVRK